MGASESGVFEVWLPSLRHKWPCETYVSMNVSCKSLPGSSRTFESTCSLAERGRPRGGGGRLARGQPRARAARRRQGLGADDVAGPGADVVRELRAAVCSSLRQTL